ncbi:hypothetical protein [Thiosulfativibrio zosterae]|uniref:Uncharacterized protein n=1 Tax=Thiosulfativibrio zosterae TaxID=2675053 RepID=A0A6F8PN71_9GAMM|nr:hypothetical protein [Thiosulfativibrio zosterae]BBP43498.1 hypothetical protein THMIRHAT_12440 [Thiosulfativibrio zosterae]
MLRKHLFDSPEAQTLFLEPTARWQTIAGNAPATQHAINHVFFYDEEAKEFWDAQSAQDLTEKLDALGDMIFVAWGIAHHLQQTTPMVASQMSILYVLDQLQLKQPYEVSLAVFQEVVRSNLSKFCQHEAEAQQTQAFYKESLDVAVSYEKVDDFFVIRSTHDQTGIDGKAYRGGKILKSIHFSEPNFSHIPLD